MNKKKYRKESVNNLVNAKQTPEKRREKYKTLRMANINVNLARRMRDWTASHIEKFLKYNNFKTSKSDDYGK
jgi:hypothetical protein